MKGVSHGFSHQLVTAEILLWIESAVATFLDRCQRKFSRAFGRVLYREKRTVSYGSLWIIASNWRARLAPMK